MKRNVLARIWPSTFHLSIHTHRGTHVSRRKSKEGYEIREVETSHCLSSGRCDRRPEPWRAVISSRISRESLRDDGRRVLRLVVYRGEQRKTGKDSERIPTSRLATLAFLSHPAGFAASRRRWRRSLETRQRCRRRAMRVGRKSLAFSWRSCETFVPRCNLLYVNILMILVALRIASAHQSGSSSDFDIRYNGDQSSVRSRERTGNREIF